MQAFTRWSLCFVAYCFIGWVWETLYVFISAGRWENRGLLFGPLLPIYGIGALVILYITVPVQTKPWLIFLLGMLGASAVEYIGGSLLEIFFHIRYWDYTAVPFNMHGHICLPSSIVWGIFSIFLVKWIHPEVKQLVCRLSHTTSSLLSFFFLLAISIDFIFSSIHTVGWH